MNADLIAVLASVLAVVLAICYAVLGWQRQRSRRTLLVGSGLALTVAGLWLGGVINLVINGLQSLVTWWGRQIWDARMLTALGLVALGVIVFAVGHAFAPTSAKTTGTPARATGQRRRTSSQRPRTTPTISTSVVPPVGSAEASSAPLPPRASSSDEDAEIEAILRKRGI